MVSPNELAEKLVKSFDPSASVVIECALEAHIAATGVPINEAAEIAEKIAPLVLSILENYPEYLLPFDFGTNDRRILVGKNRIRPKEPEAVEYARLTRGLIPEVLNALVEIGSYGLEVVCAAVLRLLSGEGFVLKGGDEGGIDFFGRIPIRTVIEGIPTNLLRTALIDWQLLVIGQAKCYAIESKIGRPEIQKFAAQITECRKKYSNNPKPPSNRIPYDYYNADEPCLPLFVTTAGYGSRARGAADDFGVCLIDGLKLAEFIIGFRVGIVEHEAGLAFSFSVFQEWLYSKERECFF